MHGISSVYALHCTSFGRLSSTDSSTLEVLQLQSAAILGRPQHCSTLCVQHLRPRKRRPQRAGKAVQTLSSWRNTARCTCSTHASVLENNVMFVVHEHWSFSFAAHWNPSAWTLEFLFCSTLKSQYMTPTGIEPLISRIHVNIQNHWTMWSDSLHQLMNASGGC